MKKTFEEIIAFIIVAIIFIAGIMIFAGLKTNNMTFVWFGLIPFIPLIIWFILTKFQMKKVEREEFDEIKSLKKTGDKIRINLEQLLIKSNSYKQEITKGSGTRSRNEYIDINHNVITLQISYRGQELICEVVIDMELEKLKMHFALQRETFLYIHLRNPNIYYLDLEFLER